MTWRYAVSREQIDGEDVFYIRELYTDEDGSLSWSEDSMSPYGGSGSELQYDLNLMALAFNGPVLDLTVSPPALVRMEDL